MLKVVCEHLFSVTQMFLQALNTASTNKSYFSEMLRCDLYVHLWLKGGHQVFENLFKWSSLLIAYISCVDGKPLADRRRAKAAIWLCCN